MVAEKKFEGWNMVFVLWLVYLVNLGFPLYGGSVINSYMMKDIPMDRATYGLGFSLCNLFVGIGAILAGKIILQWGVKRTFVCGGVVLIAGALWLSQVATAPWHYLVGFGFLLGLGMALATMLPLATTVTRWFVRSRGRAMGIAMTASGFAGFIASPAINKFIAATGGNWRLAWVVVAGAVVLSTLIAYVFLKERPEDFGQIPDGKESNAAQIAAHAANPLVTKYAWIASEVYKCHTYWLIVVASAASQWPFFFFTAHWIMHLKGAGISPAEAAFCMGLFTMGGIVGRLISGWLMDRLPARYVYMGGFCCYFLGSYLALQVSPTALMAAYIAAMCYGGGFGWCFVAQATVLGNFFGAAVFPKINGTLLAVTAVMVSASGVVGGKLFDIFHGYTQAFELNVAVCIFGIILLMFTKMPVAPSIESGSGKSIV